MKRHHRRGARDRSAAGLGVSTVPGLGVRSIQDSLEPGMSFASRCRPGEIPRDALVSTQRRASRREACRVTAALDREGRYRGLRRSVTSLGSAS